ncbi:peptidyl-prolyl cis-trans isomerase [Acetobacterium malicum]|uniref:peptidyl-prolyl cis-trans isomerase n=1 Tax=Acetobacterium malicum TaxID=52692 RepID=UPI003592E8B2
MKKSRILALMLTSVICVSLFAGGCSLVKVNPEQDKKVEIAVIDGTPLLKESFNNYMAYYQMYFDASGMTFPTDTELTELKKDILDDLVRVETLTAKAKKDGVTVDETGIAANATSMLESLKTTLGEEKYAAVLETYNTDSASFEAFLNMFLLDYSYANTMETNYNNTLKADPSKELSTVVGTVGKDEVKKDVYNYRLANEELLTYYQTQQALGTDDETMKTTNETIFNTIAEQKALAQYAEEKKLTADQTNIDSYVTTQEAFVNYLLPGDEALQQFLDAKFLTIAQFKEFVKQDATASAISKAVQTDLESTIKVTDGEIKKYYDENKASYDTSTVSAKHILATEQALADQVYAEAKNAKTVEEFDAIMAKYQTTDGIQEAADLGAFTKSTMVTEFSDAAFGMDVNTVSEPVKTDYGYHVIYVYDKKAGETPSLEDKKEEITTTLKSEKVTEEFDKLKTKLMNKFKVKINDIATPAATYLEELKTELNVKVYENKI